MALLQSAVQLARQYYDELKKKQLPAVSSAAQQVPQQIARFGQAQLNNAGNQPIIGLNTRGFNIPQPKIQAIPTQREFVQGQIVNPIKQGVQQIKQPGIANKALGGLQIAQGVTAPISTPFIVGSGAAAGALRSFRTGQPLQQSIRQGITNPTSIAQQGIGIQNPYLAGIVDIAVSRNPKGAVNGLKTIAQGLRGYSPRAFNIHPEDQAIMEDFVNRVQTGGAKWNLGKAGVDAQRLAEYYVGKKASNLTNEKLAKVFDALLSNAAQRRGEDVIQTPFPRMGLVSERDTQPLGGLLPNGGSDDIKKYIKQLTNQQQQAKGEPTLLSKISSKIKELKAQTVDFTAPIEDTLGNAEKKYKFNVRPTNDIRLQIDRVLRSKSLGSQFAEDNGLTNVIKSAPDLHALDQYMIAKQAQRVGEVGIKTGRDSKLDTQLIQELGPQYEGLAQQVNQYSRKLLDYSVESGLIDKKLADVLVKKYPDYVPLNRIFSELEQNPYTGATKAVANLSKQTVVSKLKGSEREIQSPLESLLLKTQTAFEQGEKNKAARMVGSYKDLPGFEGLIKPLEPGQDAAHKFTYLENGVKKAFETTPEIAAAAKNLNQEQMNFIVKIASFPTRALQLGATGLNIPFVVTNLAKDQATAFINSNKAAQASLLNPSNFLRATLSAVGHDDLYKEVVRNAAGGTSFDISRQAPELAINKIRASRSLKSNIAYTAKNPGELLRDLENLVGRTEELTRIQQYKGTYQALIKEGRTPEDARLLAAKAARENTANFARHGNISKVINYVVPFFNASIQGARVLDRQMRERPLQTGTKLAVGVFTPMAITTMWNTSDPKRKEAYNDIQEYEKQNNLIIIPENPVKDKNGRWNVIKIPIPPGISNLASLVRRPLEQAQGLNPVGISEVLNNLLTAGTSVDVSSPTKALSTFTPQALKPALESTTNTNLFTGLPIVPDSMKDLPNASQVKPNTSGTARIIGEKTGQSPLKIENAVRTGLGGLGSQLLNASDTVLNKAGVIPSDQVGGENAAQNIQRRFSQATGGAQSSNEFETIAKYKQAQAVESQQKKAAITKVADKLLDPNVDKTEKIRIVKALQSDKKVFNQVKDILRDKTTNVDSSDKAIRSLSSKQRALYIKEKLSLLTSKEEKRALIVDYQRKGILTKSVIDELKKK